MVALPIFEPITIANGSTEEINKRLEPGMVLEAAELRCLQSSAPMGASLILRSFAEKTDSSSKVTTWKILLDKGFIADDGGISEDVLVWWGAITIPHGRPIYLTAFITNNTGGDLSVILSGVIRDA